MSVELINEQAKTGNGIGHRKGLRRAWLALPVTAVLLLAGCSDDKDDKDKAASPSATAPAVQPSAPAPAATTPAASAPGGASTASAPGGATLTGEDKKVADNWEKLFNPATPVAERQALLENGDKLGALVETLTKSPTAAQVSAKVKTVKISGDKADVTYDVVLAGAPILPNSAGQAVKQAGEWKVSVTTICTLVSLVQAGAAVPGCPSA